MKKIFLVLSFLLVINTAMAQETSNLFNFQNFDYQSYQTRVQKFLETLTPQEKIIFVMSQSSRECELDSSVERKIDDIYEKVKDIYEKVKDIDQNLYHGWKYKIDCE